MLVNLKESKMANAAVFLVFFCVVFSSVHGFPNPDEDESELIELLRKTLSYFGSPRGQTGNGPAGPGGNKNGTFSNIDVGSTDIKDLEHLFRFPGSDFMTKLLLDFVEKDLPSDASGIKGVKDKIALDETVLDRIGALLPPLLNVAGDDNESFAETVARFLTKAVFDQHVNCPSSLLNKFMAIRWKKNATALEHESSELFKLFDGLITEFFPTFGGDAESKKQIVTKMVKRTTDEILDDTEQLILGLGFLDVARFANDVYERFRKNKGLDLRKTVLEVVDSAGVACRNGTELLGHHNFSVQIFLSAFKAEEDESVTDEIGDILLDYLERTLYAKGVSFDEDMLDAVEWEVFSKMVDGVIDYVDDQVIPDLENYISIMTKRETGAFLEMFDFLDEKERAILVEVLNRLGWESNSRNDYTTAAATQSTSEAPASVDERLVPNLFLRRRYPKW